MPTRSNQESNLVSRRCGCFMLAINFAVEQTIWGSLRLTPIILYVCRCSVHYMQNMCKTEIETKTETTKEKDQQTRREKAIREKKSERETR